MTIEKRLARSNIAMLAILLITAAALAACGALVFALIGATWRCCMTRWSRRKSRKSRS